MEVQRSSTQGADRAGSASPVGGPSPKPPSLLSKLASSVVRAAQAVFGFGKGSSTITSAHHPQAAPPGAAAAQEEAAKKMEDGLNGSPAADIDSMLLLGGQHKPEVFTPERAAAHQSKMDQAAAAKEAEAKKADLKEKNQAVISDLRKDLQPIADHMKGLSRGSYDDTQSRGKLLHEEGKNTNRSKVFEATQDYVIAEEERLLGEIDKEVEQLKARDPQTSEDNARLEHLSKKRNTMRALFNNLHGEVENVVGNSTRDLLHPDSMKLGGFFDGMLKKLKP